MPSLDHSRLVKLLNMTGSSHDAEALVAVRRSNEMLRAAGMTWSDIIQPATSNPDAVSTRSATRQGAYEGHTSEEATKPDNWGADLFGKEGIVRTTPPRLMERWRTRIRAVHFFIRLAFFPIWATIEAYAVACEQPGGVGKIFGFLAATIVALFSAGAWLALLNGALR